MPGACGEQPVDARRARLAGRVLDHLHVVAVHLVHEVRRAAGGVGQLAEGGRPDLVGGPVAEVEAGVGEADLDRTRPRPRSVSR